MRTAAELAALHALCFTKPRPYRADEFESLMSSRGMILFEQPDGFMLCRAIAGEGEILTLAVHPDARRKGVAAILMGAFEAHCQANGVTTLFLDVAEDNTAALALYDVQGFVEASRREGYYRLPNGKREDALLMVKDLA
jgi:ribosomal-protein-alanine N-acetyltransferase